MIRIILIYLFGVNLLALLLFAVDKKIARNNGESERGGRKKTKTLPNSKKGRQRRRIPENTLLLTAALGGTPGAIAGMLLFRHKTRHWQFRYGLPAMLAIQLVIVWIAVWGI